MRDLQPRQDGTFCSAFEIPYDVIDANGHVNNVAYVQCMQDIAIRHSDAVGGTRAMHEAGATWVARSHKIEYLAPAFAGDRVEIVTWVATIRRVKSLRRYRFVRTSDETLLARGETAWVFVNPTTGRPAAIPESVKDCFTIVQDPDT